MEKVLTNKKHGLVMMLLIIFMLILSVVGFVGGIIIEETVGGALGIVVILASVAFLIFTFICFGGLKVLKPQEALVLTLFGEYYGTLKGEGFYFVNPLCSAVNPASYTSLKQSGDVNTSEKVIAVERGNRMSLKIMTLSNNKQKINDCLGNPVEIGIAVMWRVVDTAKAAFNVDNYKEFLSLQCDSALRNIVRIYPYDAAPDVDTTGD